MAFEDVYLVSDRLDLVPDDDVVMAQEKLETRFPDGYREYVTALGEGLYTDFVRVYPPRQILDEIAECRERWAYFADAYSEGADVLPLNRMMESIIVFDTTNGDEVVFHPDTPNELFALPRNDGRIHRIGRTLQDALAWALESGVLLQDDRTRILTDSGQFVDRAVRYFEPYSGRGRVEFSRFETQSYQDVRDFLIALVQHEVRESLCVSHTHGVGPYHDWLQIFVKEFRGVVRCNHLAEDHGNASLQVSYDVHAQTESLERIRAYCRTHARLYMDPQGRIGPTRVESDES